MHHGVRGQSPRSHTSPSPRSKAPLLFSDPFLSPLQPLPLRSVSLTSFTSFTSFASLFSNALGRRVPDELVQLQTQPHRQAVTQNPFHEHARLEPGPLPLRIFEHRREQYLLYPPRQA